MYVLSGGNAAHSMCPMHWGSTVTSVISQSDSNPTVHSSHVDLN
jgi:hypothetical protein